MYQNVTEHPQRNEILFTQDQSLSQYNKSKAKSPSTTNGWSLYRPTYIQHSL